MENTENMGKIKSLDEEYTRIKASLEPKSKRYNEIVAEINKHMQLLEMFKEFKKEPELLQESQSSLSDEEIDRRIQEETEKIEPLREELKQLQTEIGDIQKNIGYRVDELVRENPEVADAIKAETVKKYIGKTKEKQEEVKKLSDKKEKIEAIKKALEDSPALRSFLRPILEKQSEINSLETQLKGITVKDEKSGITTYTNNEEANRLGEEIIKAKEANMKNKQEFIQSIGIKGLQIEDIDELISGEIVKDERGNVIVDKTIEKKEESIKIQLDEKNKDISHYLSELEKRGEISPAQEPKNGKPEYRNLPAQTKERWYKKLAKKISNFLHRNNEEPEDRGIVGQQDENAEQQDENMRSQQEKASKEFLDRIRNLGIIKEVVVREEKPFERTNAQPQQDNSKQDHGGPEL